MGLEASFVYCGGENSHGTRHPIIRLDSSPGCFICHLYRRNAELVLGIKAAADLLEEGKAVQCHRGLIDLITSMPDKGEGGT